MRFESRRGPKKEKKQKQKFCNLENLFFFLLVFSLFLFFCTSKVIEGFFNNYDYLMKI
jgi:hypothetical protein